MTVESKNQAEQSRVAADLLKDIDSGTLDWSQITKEQIDTIRSALNKKLNAAGNDYWDPLDPFDGLMPVRGNIAETNGSGWRRPIGH